MKINLIYAQNEDGAIGLAGPHPLPWHHPEDLARFKQLTTGKAMVMGTNTFDSLPGLLPGRFHYILTRSKGLPRLGRLDRAQFLNSVDKVLEVMAENGEDELFVIGGADIINQTLSKATTIYRTIVLNHPLKGNVVKVARPQDNHPDWDGFYLTEHQMVGDRLIFETYEHI